MRSKLALTLLLCPLMLSAAGMMDESSEANSALTSPATVATPSAAFAEPAIALRLAQPAGSTLISPRNPADDGKLLWRWSAVALVASSGFDAASSYGKWEGNSVLQSANGSFGMRGAVIKSGIALSTLAVEYMLRRRYGHSRVFAIANFVQAGVTSAVAARNLGVPRMQ